MADETAQGAGVDETQESSQVEEQTQDLEEKEPGGDSPEQIRARKEYRLRKKIEAEAQTEREKVIALEARVQTLQEVAQRKPSVDQQEPPKRFTSAEALRKVDNGEWTREQASDYIADSRYLVNRTQEKAEEAAVRNILGPVEEAQKEAFEYVALDPRLKNGTHPKFKEILKQVAFYRREDPKRTPIQAERLAMRQVLGDLGDFRESLKTNNARPSGDHHVETMGGGVNLGERTRTDKFADIPQYTKDLWEKTNTSPKDREIEAKYWRENRARRLGK